MVGAPGNRRAPSIEPASTPSTTGMVSPGSMYPRLR